MWQLLKSDLLWQLVGGFVLGSGAMVLASPSTLHSLAAHVGAVVYFIG